MNKRKNVTIIRGSTSVSNVKVRRPASYDELNKIRNDYKKEGRKVTIYIAETR